MKSHGYAKGGTIGDLINKTGEDGFVLARTGEEILSLEKIRELTAAFQAMNPVVSALSSIPDIASMRESTSGSTSIDNMNISFTLPNVTNYDEFLDKMRTDKRAERLVQALSVDKLNKGNNSLRKYNI